jgi:hypothetical protein
MLESCYDDVDNTSMFFLIAWGRRGRLVLGFTTTYTISAYHHQSCEFESRSWQGVGGGGADLKKLRRAERIFFGGISCEKSRFYAKKSYFIQLRRNARKFFNVTLIMEYVRACWRVISFQHRGGSRGRVPLLKLEKNMIFHTKYPKHFRASLTALYDKKFVSDLWYVCGFLRALRFPPPIKLIAARI